MNAPAPRLAIGSRFTDDHGLEWTVAPRHDAAIQPPGTLFAIRGQGLPGSGWFQRDFAIADCRPIMCESAA